MVPVIFGTAGAWSGYRAIAANTGRRAEIVALAIGALAAIASVAMYAATS